MKGCALFMYDYLTEEANLHVVGSFNTDKNKDFKDSCKSLMEGFQSTYQVDAIADIARILKIDALKEAYKSMLLEDVDVKLGDPYLDMLPQKLEQLFENSSLEILKESGVAALAPIVGISLPILKKTYVEGHAKDIVMTEIPSKPIIKAAFERRFLKDTDNNRHYIPDIFYNDKYKEIMSMGKGKPISQEYYPTSSGTLPFQDLNILELSGGNIRNRDTLAMDFCVQSVMLDVDGTLVPVSINASPNMAADSSFYCAVSHKKPDGTIVKDSLMGRVDFYLGTVSCTSTGGLIKKVQFGGRLSNENNNETIELDRERELMEWKIPDGYRINTGLTLEKIKDYKALFDFDITTEIISDMSTVLSQVEDSDVLGFLNESYDKWKTKTTLPFGYEDGFTATGYFNCNPPSNKFVTRSQWIESELKFDLNRFIDELKVKLRHPDLMFVVYGHPNHITLIQDNVRWVIDEDTKIGGIQLDYKFGVMTANKNRIHVISTLKCPKSRGIRVVAYPTSKEQITFKHYKYSLNIENAYRNANTPLIPNIMGTSRFITTEVLPLQGEFHILEDEFALKDPSSPATTQVAPPFFSLSSGTYDEAQTVAVTCPTPGANVYYTVDGNEPTAQSTLLTGGAVSITATATLKAIAMKPGMINSSVSSATYTIS